MSRQKLLAVAKDVGLWLVGVLVAVFLAVFITEILS